MAFIDCWNRHAAGGGLTEADQKSIVERADEHVKFGMDRAEAIKRSLSDHIEDTHQNLHQVFKAAGVQVKGVAQAGITKEAIDQSRAERDLAPIERQKVIDFGEANAKADAILAKDPDAGRKLIEDLKKSKRSLDARSAETPLAITRMAQTAAEFDQAAAAVEADPANAEARARLEKAQKEHDRVTQVVDASTSSSGANLGSLRMLRAHDYSRATMESRVRAIKGEALTEEQTAEIKDIAEQYKANEQEIASQPSPDQMAALKAEGERIKREYYTSVEAAKETGRQEREASADEKTRAARARVAEKKLKLKGSEAGFVDAGMLRDLAQVGAHHIGRGLTKFADWSSRMVREFGEWVRPHLANIWGHAKRLTAGRDTLPGKGEGGHFGTGGGLTAEGITKSSPVEAAKLLAKGREIKNGVEDEFFGKIWPKLLRETGELTSPRGKKNFQIAAQKAVAGVRTFLEKNPQFADYYNKDWDITRKQFDEYFGRPVTDDEMKMLQMATGITSIQTDLKTNTMEAANALRHWAEHGNFDALVTGPKEGTGNLQLKSTPFSLAGPPRALKAMNLKIVDRLTKELGSATKAAEHLIEPVTQAELNKFNQDMGYKGKVEIGPIRELVQQATGQHELIPRAFIFGKKVGAYTLDHLGQHQYNTVDRWEARFIRSQFSGMFKENFNLPNNVDEHTIFTKFTDAFNEEFKKETGVQWENSALQAARWFYILDAVRESGYTKARTSESISEYTKGAIEQLRRTDQTRGPPSNAEGGAGVEKPTGDPLTRLADAAREQALTVQQRGPAEDGFHVIIPPDPIEPELGSIEHGPFETKQEAQDFIDSEVGSPDVRIVEIRNGRPTTNPFNEAQIAEGTGAVAEGDALKRQADAARERIKQRSSEGGLLSGIDPRIGAHLVDEAIIGAEHFRNGAKKFGDWSKKMIEEFGDWIEPHLKDIWEESKKMAAAVRSGKRGPLSDEQRLAQAIKRKEAGNVMLETKLRTGDITKPQKRAPIVPNERLRAAEIKRVRLKERFDRLYADAEYAARPTWMKVADAGVEVTRALKLMGIKIFGKLGGAAVTRLGLNPVEHQIGGLIATALPKLVRENARELGVPSLSGEAAAFKVGARSWKQVGRILRDQRTDAEIESGVKDTYRPGGKIMKVLRFPGKLHAVEKAPVKESTRAYSTVAEEESYARSGTEITPEIRAEIGHRAHTSALRAIFMNENAFSRLMRGGIQSAERYGPSGFVLAKAMQWALPIVKVPTNIAIEAGVHGTGLLTGAGKLIQVMHRGMSTIKPEEADYIVRHLTKGTIGAGLFALGYLNPNMFGGFYEPGQKRGADEVKWGGMRIGGVTIPAWLLHAPAFIVLNAGATARKIVDRKGKTGGAGNVALGVLRGFTEEIPFIENMANFDKLFVPGYEGTKARGMALSGSLVPQGLREIAGWTDPVEKRSPKTAFDYVRMGIPGWRESVKPKSSGGTLSPELLQ